MTGAMGRYEAWSEADEHVLRSMLLGGKGLTLTALKLRRSKGAVKQRAQRLGISIVDGRPLKSYVPPAELKVRE